MTTLVFFSWHIIYSQNKQLHLEMFVDDEELHRIWMTVSFLSKLGQLFENEREYC